MIMSEEATKNKREKYIPRHTSDPVHTVSFLPFAFGVQAGHVVHQDAKDAREESREGQLRHHLGEEVGEHAVHVQAPFRLNIYIYSKNG